MKSKIIKLTLGIIAGITIAGIAISGILFLIVEPYHGRNWTIPLIDGMVIQADPPAKKLLKYMEEKYNKEFTQVYVEPSTYSGECRHHDWGSTL